MHKVDKPSTQWAMRRACCYGNGCRFKHDGGKGLPASPMLEAAFTTIRASSPHSPLCARLVHLAHTCLLSNFVLKLMLRRSLCAVFRLHPNVREHTIVSFPPCLFGVHEREAFSTPQLTARCSCLVAMLMTVFKRMHKTDFSRETRLILHVPSSS